MCAFIEVFQFIHMLQCYIIFHLLIEQYRGGRYCIPGSRAAWGQAVLPCTSGCIWPWCGDHCSGGRCTASHTTHHTSMTSKSSHYWTFSDGPFWICNIWFKLRQTSVKQTSTGLCGTTHHKLDRKENELKLPMNRSKKIFYE